MKKDFLFKTFIAVFFLGLASMFGFSEVLGYGGGGTIVNSVSTNCASVSYGEWGACVNGTQYRDIASKSSQDCTLTSSQQLGRSQTCGNSEEKKDQDSTSDDEDKKEAQGDKEENKDKQVLGDKTYADGTLLKGSDNKIYVMVNGKLKHITTLAELAKYKGQTILKVDDSVIKSLLEKKEVLGDKTYADGTLLKGSDNKIYVMVNGKLKHITTLAELAKYKGQTILKVDDSVIKSLLEKKEVLGDKTYADGTLVRIKGDNKIYVILNGKKVHIKTLAELRKYAGKTILDVTADDLKNY